jgi:hypothetical protein
MTLPLPWTTRRWQTLFQGTTVVREWFTGGFLKALSVSQASKDLSIIIWKERGNNESWPNLRIKSSIFWYITTCSSLKVKRRFWGTCTLHLQGLIMSQARNKHETGSKQSQATCSSETTVDFKLTTSVIPQKTEIFITTTVRTSILHNLRIYHGIYPEESSKITKNLSQGNRSPDRGMRPEPSEYKAGVLPTRSWCLVVWMMVSAKAEHSKLFSIVLI